MTKHHQSEGLKIARFLMVLSSISPLYGPFEAINFYKTTISLPCVPYWWSFRTCSGQGGLTKE